MSNLERIQEIFDDILSVEVDENTIREQLDVWDSLAMINIIVAVQDEFGIVVNLDEAGNIKSVADLLKLIEGKQN